MAWLLLKQRVSYEEAEETVRQYKQGAVCLASPRKQTRPYTPTPIAYRRLAGGSWYNYYDDGTYSRISVGSDTKILKCYAPCFFVPDRLRFSKLVEYIDQQMGLLKGKYNAYMLYETQQHCEVVYSVLQGIIQIPIEVMFGDPMLFFITGRAK